MSGFEDAPTRPSAFAQKVEEEKKKLRKEIEDIRAHAHDLEQNLEEIARARATPPE
jgi:cell division protein FtsB